MRHSVAVIILIVSFAWAHDEDSEGADRTSNIQDSADSMNKSVDSLVGELFSRGLKALPLNHGELEKTLLGKANSHCNPLLSSHSSIFLPSGVLPGQRSSAHHIIASLAPKAFMSMVGRRREGVLICRSYYRQEHRVKGPGEGLPPSPEEILKQRKKDHALLKNTHQRFGPAPGLDGSWRRFKGMDNPELPLGTWNPSRMFLSEETLSRAMEEALSQELLLGIYPNYKRMEEHHLKYLTARIQLYDLVGQKVIVQLFGKFFIPRFIVLERLSIFLRNRIPEIESVEVQDPAMVDPTEDLHLPEARRGRDPREEILRQEPRPHTPGEFFDNDEYQFATLEEWENRYRETVLAFDWENAERRKKKSDKKESEKKSVSP